MNNEKNIHKLLQIVLQINKSENYFAWLRFSGHVNQIEIQVSKKSDYNDNLYSKYIFMDYDNSDKEIKKMINELIEKYIIYVPDLTEL